MGVRVVGIDRRVYRTKLVLWPIDAVCNATLRHARGVAQVWCSGANDDIYHMELDWQLENRKRATVTPVSGALAVGVQPKRVLEHYVPSRVQGLVVLGVRDERKKKNKNVRPGSKGFCPSCLRVD